MLARIRFGRIDDCSFLLSKFVSTDGVHSNMLYEWVNPLTFQGNGAYPFRTGISSIRIAAIESLTQRAYNTTLISNTWNRVKVVRTLTMLFGQQCFNKTKVI